MSELNQPATILVIDDEIIVRQSICYQLEDLGFIVLEAKDGEQGIALIKEIHIDLVLTDLRMPGMTGLDVIQQSKLIRPNLLIIVISGAGHIGDAVEAMRLGAYDYLVKPIKSLDVLNQVIVKALERTKQLKKKQNDALKLEHNVRAETQEQEKEFLGSVINSLADPLFVKDEQHRWIVLNDAFCQMLGKERSELLGKSDYDLFSQPQADAYWAHDDKIFNSSDVDITEEELKTEDGIRTVLTSKLSFMNPTTDKLNLVGTIRDITDQKIAEQALRRSQKMEAIGQLTGGIAHDFNNILGIILGNISLLAPLVTNNYPAKKRVEAIEKSALRAADLTKQLLGFSRKQPAQVVTTDINQVIAEMENLVARSVTPEVTIEHHFAPDLWLAELDPGDFEDALMNILINARDAMDGRGRIVIETNNVSLDEADCAQSSGLSPGDYVQLSVTDSGEGIAADLIDKIFEPFYSTKPKGEGSGLGLAMVFGFVKRSKGYINVYSEKGIGTTFRLYLPQSTSSVQAASDDYVEKNNELPWGNETILVVDDETELLEIAKEYLSSLGYNVLSASNGKQAMFHLTERHDISLLFTDVVMPGTMSGYELADLVLDSHPELKVLFTSGYSDKDITNNNSDKLDSQLLTKPYTKRELAQRVRTVLGESSHKETVATNDKQQLEQPLLLWSEELNVGIEHIDEDHKLLVDTINNMLLVDRVDMDNCLQRLTLLTSTHFEREEKVMEECGYPGLTNHRQVHRLLMRQLTEKSQMFDKGILDHKGLMLFLDGWLVEHTKTMDQAYVPYCDGAEKVLNKSLIESVSKAS